MSTGPSDYGTEAGAAQILKRLSEYTSTVVRQELHRAQLEGSLSASEPQARAAGSATLTLLGRFGAGAAVAVVAIALAQVLAPWVAALAMWFILLTVATALTFDDKRRVLRTAPLKRGLDVPAPTHPAPNTRYREN